MSELVKDEAEAEVELRIGDLAARTGVSPRSLRYYEQQGLLVSDRTGGGHRVYTRDAVDRVDLIQLLFRAGLGSAEVVRIMPCLSSYTTTPDMVRVLQDERDRLDSRIEEFLTMRRRLDTVLADAVRRLETSTS